jgi:hypothetical protein
MRGLSRVVSEVLLAAIVLSSTVTVYHVLSSNLNPNIVALAVENFNVLDGSICLTVQNYGSAVVEKVSVVEVLADDGANLLGNRLSFAGNPATVSIKPGQAKVLKFTVSRPIFFPNVVDPNVDVNLHPLGTSVQRKTFYANGFFYVFYVDSAGRLVYRLSGDGIVWSQAYTVKAPAYSGDTFSVFYQNGKVHVAYSSGQKRDPVEYVMGVLGENGIISWGSWQTVLAGTNKEYSSVVVSVDSDDRPWVACLGPSGVTVAKSSRGDGVWSMSEGFPKTVNANPSPNTQVTLAKLSGGKMYVAWYAPNSKLAGRLWNGIEFEGEEDIAHSVPVAKVTLSATSYMDRVYVAYTQYSRENIVYCAVREKGKWLQPEKVVENISPPTYLATTAAEDGGLHVFWTTFSSGRFQLGSRFRTASGEWCETEFLAEDQSTEIMFVSSSYSDLGGEVPVAYVQGNSLMFQHLMKPVNLREARLCEITLKVESSSSSSLVKVKVRG